MTTTPQDDTLILSAKAGNADALEELMEKYKNLVRAKARPYFLVGADKEDIVQEGMIGLYRAVQSFDPKRHPSFAAFADICVTRQIISAIKSATRMKHQPLNTYVSLYRPVYDDGAEKTLMDTLPTPEDTDPETLYIMNEEQGLVDTRINKILTPLERDVLVLYLDGASYAEISRAIDRSPKAVDNAIQRVKKKIEAHMVKDK